MQNTSSWYRNNIALPHSFNWYVRFNGTTELQPVGIYSIKVSGSMFPENTLSFGGCVSRQVEIVMKNLTSISIPRMGKIEPRFQLVPNTGSATYNRYSLGTFYIDTRSVDKATNKLTLVGYDAMLMAEANYVTGIVGDWPQSMAAVVTDIADILDLEIDSRSATVSSTYMVDSPMEYTMREILGYIAAAHCGNWVITPEGKLRLITATSSVDTININKKVKSYSFEEPFQTITHVHIDVDDENYYEAVSATDNGRTLTLKCPWATQAMANNILTSLSGFAYQPFSADGAIIDPAIEIGDKVTIDGTTGIMVSQDCYCDSLTTFDIGAPSEEEIDHEFPYKSSTERILGKTLRTDQSYYGNRMNRIEGFVSEQIVNGTAVARLVANAGTFAMQSYDNGAWVSHIYFDTATNKYIIDGNVTLTGIVTVYTPNGSAIIQGSSDSNYEYAFVGGASPASSASPPSVDYLYLMAKRNIQIQGDVFGGGQSYSLDLDTGVFAKFSGDTLKLGNSFDDGLDDLYSVDAHITTATVTNCRASNIISGQYYTRSNNADHQFMTATFSSSSSSYGTTIVLGDQSNSAPIINMTAYLKYMLLISSPNYLAIDISSKTILANGFSFGNTGSPLGTLYVTNLYYKNIHTF